MTAGLSPGAARERHTYVAWQSERWRRMASAFCAIPIVTTAAWQVNPWVKRHLGISIGLDRNEVLARARGDERAIEMVVDRLAAKR